ncbi:MAG TPA: threonine synthase, partial [Candidatus Brocadiaceae bacterium]
GDPVSYKKAINVLKAFHGIVEQATEDELANASAQADTTGLFSCPHTGVALAVLIKLIKRKEIGPKEQVVVISTAHGLKFSEFKINYHENNLEEVTPRFANLPVEVPAQYEAVKSAIFRKFEQIP